LRRIIFATKRILVSDRLPSPDAPDAINQSNCKASGAARVLALSIAPGPF
jgi:hypothetical protein